MRDMHEGSVVAPWMRLGYIVPHLHVDMDAFQFYKVAPEGMMLVTTTLDLRGYGKEDVMAEAAKIGDRVDVLSGAGVDFISLSGVPIGSALGPAATRALVGEMSSRSGLPCSTDLESHVKALRHLAVERLALATRWPDPVVEGLRSYLDEAGVSVVSSESQPRSLEENKKADPMRDHQLALELGSRALRAAPEAQALLMPGGLWFAIHAAAAIEADFGVPVLLNITSTVWEALHGRKGSLPHRPDPGWGYLLASL